MNCTALRRTKTVLTWVTSAIMISLILFAAFMIIASILGWQFNPVMSGSMDPVYKVGDVVATKKVDPATIKIGDVITYRAPQIDKVVVHRVIDRYEGDQVYFETKGDANEDADPYPVPAENIMNKVGFHIPCLGYVSQFFTSSKEIILMFALSGLLIFGKEIEKIQTKLLKVQKNSIQVPVKTLAGRAQWAAGLSTEDWIEVPGAV